MKLGAGDRLFLGAAALGLLLILGLVIDTALVVGNYRVGQAALDLAAQSAATAVEVSAATGAWELRQVDSPDQLSAYTLAEQALGDARNRVQILDLFSDGQRVFLRGQVAAPTLLARVVGVPVITLDLVAGAALRPPAVP